MLQFHQNLEEQGTQYPDQEQQYSDGENRAGQDQYQEVPTGEVEGERRAMQNHSTEQNGREQLEDQPPSPEAAEYQNEQQ